MPARRPRSGSPLSYPMRASPLGMRPDSARVAGSLRVLVYGGAGYGASGGETQATLDDQHAPLAEARRDAKLRHPVPKVAGPREARFGDLHQRGWRVGIEQSAVEGKEQLRVWPVQRRLPSMLSGLGSMEAIERMSVTGNYFGPGWDHLGSFRFLCVRYLYVDPVLRRRSVVLVQGESPLELGGDWLPGLGR
jgi:hypothetical protein